MSSLENIIISFAGLGLFLSGLKFLSSSTKLFTGKRFNNIALTLTKNRFLQSTIGFIIGAFTQSTSAATFFIMGLMQSQTISSKKAFCLLSWSSVGTSVLIFLVSLDIHFAGYLMLSLVGLIYFFNLKNDKFFIYTAPLIFSFGLIFLGLGLIKVGSVIFQDNYWINEFFEFASETVLISIILGIFLTLISQSASVITILVITLVVSSIIPLEAGAFMIIGGNLGSGVAIVLFHSHLYGLQKRVLFFQLIAKLFGTIALFCTLVLSPNFIFVSNDSIILKDLALKLSLLYFYLQLAGAIITSLLEKNIIQVLKKYIPDNQNDSVTEVHYIYPEAVKDSIIANELIKKEQFRLIAFLPDYIDILRTKNSNISKQDFHESLLILQKRIKQFTDEVITEDSKSNMQELLKLQTKNDLIYSLLLTLHSFITSADEKNVKNLNLKKSMVESLHLITGLLKDVETSHDNIELIQNLTSDQGPLMDNIRDNILSNQKLSNQEQNGLFVLTRVFERSLWQVREYISLK